jgi:hypothetical protein
MECERATKLTGWPGVIRPILAHPSAPARDIPALVGPASLVGARHSSLGMTETIASYTYVFSVPFWLFKCGARSGSRGPVATGRLAKRLARQSITSVGVMLAVPPPIGA